MLLSCTLRVNFSNSNIRQLIKTLCARNWIRLIFWHVISFNAIFPCKNPKCMAVAVSQCLLPLKPTGLVILVKFTTGSNLWTLAVLLASQVYQCCQERCLASLDGLHLETFETPFFLLSLWTYGMCVCEREYIF